MILLSRGEAKDYPEFEGTDATPIIADVAKNRGGIPGKEVTFAFTGSRFRFEENTLFVSEWQPPAVVKRIEEDATDFEEGAVADGF